MTATPNPPGEGSAPDSTPTAVGSEPATPSPGSHVAAQALRDAADALSYVWGDDLVPASLVYLALRDRADKIAGGSA